MNETLQTAPVSLTVPPAKTKSFLLELVWASLRHDLDASAVALGARAAVSADDLDAATTDALWFVSLAVESDAPKRARLADLARALVDTEGVVRKSTLMERCEGEFLEEAGFVASASAFRKKEIRVNTRVVYTQKKFNLLREESEGYAKVLAVLAAFADTNANTKKQSRVSGAVRAVQSLIGAFDLDPNRVLDLTLEACELARRAGDDLERLADRLAGVTGTCDGRCPRRSSVANRDDARNRLVPFRDADERDWFPSPESNCCFFSDATDASPPAILA